MVIFNTHWSLLRALRLVLAFVFLHGTWYELNPFMGIISLVLFYQVYKNNACGTEFCNAESK